MQTRRIRSFVLRAGRTTAAQERALENLWPAYGIALGEGPLDLPAVFGRVAPRCLEIGFGAGEVIGSLAEAILPVDYLGVEVHRSGVGRLLLRAAAGLCRTCASSAPTRWTYCETMCLMTPSTKCWYFFRIPGTRNGITSAA